MQWLTKKKTVLDPYTIKTAESNFKMSFVIELEEQSLKSVDNGKKSDESEGFINRKQHYHAQEATTTPLPTENPLH
jgi:hypothetical protein